MAEKIEAYDITEEMKERIKLPKSINKKKLWHVIYQYGHEDRPSEANPGWGIRHVIKTKKGSIKDIPKEHREMDSTHFIYTIDADSEGDAIQKVEDKLRLDDEHPDKFRGLNVKII